MRPHVEFREQLDAIVRAVPADGREQVSELVASVVDAGATSERAVIEMAKDQTLDTRLRSDLCWLVPRLGIEAAGDLLTGLMADPSEQIRMEAAAGLGLVPDDGVVDVLLAALADESSQPVRLAVLHALGVRSSPRSAAGVMGVLQDSDEDPEVRADAAEALAHVEDERIVPFLIGYLQDRSPLVRYSAAYALGEQGDVSALPALRHLAAHDCDNTPWGSVASRALRSLQVIADREAREERS